MVNNNRRRHAVDLSFAKLSNGYAFRNLNNNTGGSTVLTRYTKEDIIDFLKNPESNQNQLQQAIVYLYNVSSHFKRLIKYFAGLTNWAYIIVPKNIEEANPDQVLQSYKTTAKKLQTMCLAQQLDTIMTVVLREDIFYGCIREYENSIIIQQLPFSVCRLEAIEDNVFNVSFDFSYFQSNPSYLEYYPQEFKTKYNAYSKDTVNKRWQQLDSATSFAVKFNRETPNYSVPPLAGLLTDLYDIEDYKDLNLTKAELEIYKMLVMEIPVDKQGDEQIFMDNAEEYYNKMAAQLPAAIGSTLSPMPVKAISFEKNAATKQVDEITAAESHLFTAAGVSSQLLSANNTTATGLYYSIGSDQAMVYTVVKSIEAVINRFMKHHTEMQEFNISFLDVSRYNQPEISELLLKGCQNGAPMVSAYCASLGLNPLDMEQMCFLEQDVLKIHERFKPLQSSFTQASGDSANPVAPPGETSTPVDEINPIAEDE